MEVRMLEAAQDLVSYDAWVCGNPSGNLWQSLQWKKYQASLGRETRIYALMEGTHILAAALVVIDRTSFGLSTWDIPRGPVWGLGNRNSDLGHFLETIVSDAKANHCLSLYLSPVTLLPATSYQLAASSRHEQPAATRIIDLTLAEEEILSHMKPKGRYNISVAGKHGIRVEQSHDISAFMGLLKQTGQRDNFTILSARHYESFLKELPGSFLFLALSQQGVPIAGLLGVIWASKAYYYYGASDHAERALMAPYALQWAAMRFCKAQGCTSYDLLGVSPPDAQPDHPWQGVSTFKEKFGGQVVTYPQEQQIVLRPRTYKLLQLKRKLLG
ncbi:MAG: peptidoglycan bridge formation glycyltransferase FemA/FemB family protein [Candidatus Peribacter sp.]|nr:peptidoglycan bridge formation glycyltransferase FemA/FemB family protein [Candidatus Peribacter sp.]